MRRGHRPDMTPSPDPWSFFDKIYCISIDTRNDRRTEAKKQFSRVNLLHRVEFVLVEKHPDNPEKGIFMSHMGCLRKGLQAGAKHILIFEDDVIFDKFEPQTLLDAVQFLDTHQEWNGFFLGAMSSGVTHTGSPSVLQIQYRCLAHAYGLNRAFAEQLITKSWGNVPYDTLLRSCGGTFFALSPMIAFQSTATSDNHTFLLDRMRRVFGGLPFLQKVNEFFQYYKLPIVSVHVLILVLLSLLVIFR